MNPSCVYLKKATGMILGSLFLLGTAQAASFDCGKATTEVEKLICRNDELSKLDESLNEAYLQTLNRTDIKQQTIKSQKQWLKYERNVCQSTKCIKTAYENRIKELGFTSAFGIVFFRDPSRYVPSPKTSVEESKSQAIEPPGKVIQEQTEQELLVFTLNEGILVKGCPEPIPYEDPFKSKERDFYIKAFQEGYQTGLKKGYESKLEITDMPRNPAFSELDAQRRIWFRGWTAGRWYGVAQATGHSCIKRATPWPVAPLKIRYAFFREAMKSTILNTYKMSDAVFMLGQKSKPYCEELLSDILSDENIELVEPLLKFENTDHPALINYRSCDSTSALHFKNDDFNRINSRATTFSEIGTQAFRFYGDFRLGENKIAKDVIYSESEPYFYSEGKPYFAGYLALNSQSCELSVLATNNPTTFRVSDHPLSLSDNFLIKWRGKYINVEAHGDPPYVVRADSLDIREEGFHTIDCDWVGHSRGAAERNPWGGKAVLRSIIRDKTEKRDSDKGRGK